MSFFSNLFSESNSGNEHQLVKPLSSVSRIVDENGEPQLKLYPEMANNYSDEQIKDLILAVAIVNEDLLKDNFEINTFPMGNFTNPLLRASKKDKNIYVVVRIARKDNNFEPLAIEEIKILQSDYSENLYEANIGLLYVGDDNDGKPNFFVNYRGLQKITDFDELR